MGMFERLRDDSPEEAAERTDIVAALAFGAGLAAALGGGGDELRRLDGLERLVWVFVGGLSLGFAIYWIAGWALSFVAPRLGASGSRRRTRHILAFSFAPLALALVVWLVWAPLLLLLAGWSLVLLLLGLREVYGWTWLRSASAVALSTVWLGALAACLLSLLVLLGRFGE